MFSKKVDDITFWYNKKLKKLQEKRDNKLFKNGLDALCSCDCGNELISNSKNIEELGNDKFEYECANCGMKTVLRFGITPLPLFIKNNVRKSEYMKGGG